MGGFLLEFGLLEFGLLEFGLLEFGLFSKKIKGMEVNTNTKVADAEVELEVPVRSVSHPYHVVRPSRWPIILAVTVATFIFCSVFFRHGVRLGGLLKVAFQWSVIMLVLVIACWAYDVHLEAAVEGCHTKAVQQNLLFGFVLFIVSEIRLFASFFWAFGHAAVNPSVFIGEIWPPIGVKPLYPYALPLTNTILLLSSGVLVTWVHHIVVNVRARSRLRTQFEASVGRTAAETKVLYGMYNVAEESATYLISLFVMFYKYAGLDGCYYDEWSRRWAVEFMFVEGNESELDEVAKLVVGRVIEDRFVGDVQAYSALKAWKLTEASFTAAELGFWFFNVRIINKYARLTAVGLVGALVYGLVFTGCQFYEYTHALFDISDSVYGSVFYRLTGLHGLHVIVGSVLLAVQLVRFLYGAVFADSPVGLLTRIWYWHFVDIVWLFVFLGVYVWGGMSFFDDLADQEFVSRVIYDRWKVKHGGALEW